MPHPCGGREQMINVFVLQNGRLSQVNIDTREDLERAVAAFSEVKAALGV